MIYARFAGDTVFLQPPAAPVLEPIGEVEYLPLTIHWSHEDSLNPAIGFDVWRFSQFERITDDLETQTGNWVTDGFVISAENSHSAEHSYWSRDMASSDFTLTSTEPIEVASGDSIKFWTWYDMFDGWSYAYVEVLVDGQDWTSIPGNITTTDDPHGVNLGHGITGNSAGWVRGLFDLSDYAGQEISYRFHYLSAEFGSSSMFLDDIYPVDRFAEVVQIADTHPDTSFTVSELQMGEHCFQVFAVDAEAQRSVGSAIEPATVTSWIPGDADASGGVDIDDAVFLITYIFADGPAPDPIGRGDADCSGDVDIDDVVYVITYIFGGGPPPGDPDNDGIPNC
jgi:hypothetical protein